MEIWKIESNPIKQMIMSCLISIIGLIFVIYLRNADIHASSNVMAGYLLGWLLLIIGIASIIAINKQYITVDPEKRCIIIEDINLLGSKIITLSFDEIIDVQVAEIGKRSNYTVTYYVLLKLKSGKTFPLFFPAYYNGRWDASVAENRCSRLKVYIQH